MPRKEPNPDSKYQHRVPGPTTTRQAGESTREKQESLDASESRNKLGDVPEEDTSIILTDIEQSKR